MNLDDGVDSMTNFNRQTAEYLQRPHKTVDPVIITVNGKAQVVVQNSPRLAKAARSGGQVRTRGDRRGDS
jgi:prevent-host-death family protein